MYGRRVAENDAVVFVLDSGSPNFEKNLVCTPSPSGVQYIRGPRHSADFCLGIPWYCFESSISHPFRRWIYNRNGHGSHILSLVGGKIHGVSLGKLISIKCCDDQGNYTDDSFGAAIDIVNDILDSYSITKPIVNMSFGDPLNDFINKMTERLAKRAIVLVAARLETIW